MFNLSISPPLTELILKPGARFTQAYQIKNNSHQTIYLSTVIKQWQPKDNTGSITYFDYTTDQITFNLNNADLKIGQSFYISPNQEKQLVLKLDSLPDTPDQDYYFTLFLNQVDPGGQTSSALGQIGSHILISSSTNMSTQVNANIKSINITPKIKDVFFTPISFQIDLQNQSPNFFKAEGKLIIQKGSRLIEEIPITPQNILANSSHLLACQDNPDCSIKPPFWPGPYTATLKLDSEVNYTSPPHTFLVLPYSIFALIIIISIIIFLFKKLKNSKPSS
jgi:hypothetical protein